ncbi:MAG: LPS export ABC transporter ATP-binding protein [Bacteroidetes bacterium]|nr:LPS export ABC transporter ATP-binding protein [Bacteroidota bacterium]MCY4233010.1 LPS export ABC transporter ATP-binding protein [Bacteroidota bacterium]
MGALKLRAEKLTKKFKKRTVVNQMSLNVECGEVVGLLGPNGAGKTTSFHMIVGLERPNQGRIYLGDQDITGLPMYQRARQGLGYLAQETSVFQRLTVEQNLHAVLEFQKISRQERDDRVDELISQFGLESIRTSKAYTLSGGERRRTEIARSMVLKPKFFLLDEPFAGVDPITVEYIQDIICQLAQMNIGILITDHNVHETLAITDRAYLLFDGKIMKSGTAEQLASDPQVRQHYLGEKFALDRYR